MLTTNDYCNMRNVNKTIIHITEPYLLKPSQKDPKPAKTTQKNSETTRNDPKFQNWGNPDFSTSFRFSNFEPKCSNLGILGQEVSTF